MRLHALQLAQFRNYLSLALEFPQKDAQIFVGENGSGKTNVLEAVSTLAFTKSFLAVEEDDVRQWGTDFYRVTCQAVSDAGEEKTLEVVSQIEPRRQKVCFRNDVRVNASQMIGELPIVFFLPQDLSLFTGSPAERRRYLDQILCQVSREYFAATMEYQKALKQRNALLRAIREGRGSTAELGPWDEGLADRGSLVTLLRLELMETFSLSLAEELKELGAPWSEIRMVYERTGESRERDGLRAELREILMRNAERDVILQSTTTGPHRDDWHMLVDDRRIEASASRGQQRVAVLALLFLEASYLELRRGEKPIILLDDIFSELDEAHRERVHHAFKDHQVLMTATDLPQDVKGTVWEVGDGAVQRVTKKAYTARHG